MLKNIHSVEFKKNLFENNNYQKVLKFTRLILIETKGEIINRNKKEAISNDKFEESIKQTAEKIILQYKDDLDKSLKNLIKDFPELTTNGFQNISYEYFLNLNLEFEYPTLLDNYSYKFNDCQENCDKNFEAAFHYIHGQYDARIVSVALAIAMGNPTLAFGVSIYAVGSAYWDIANAIDDHSTCSINCRKDILHQ